MNEDIIHLSNVKIDNRVNLFMKDRENLDLESHIIKATDPIKISKLLRT